MISIIKALIQGMSITLKYFFRKPITLQYPKEKRQPYERFRGAQQLVKDENGWWTIGSQLVPDPKKRLVEDEGSVES